MKKIFTLSPNFGYERQELAREIELWLEKKCEEGQSYQLVVEVIED